MSRMRKIGAASVFTLAIITIVLGFLRNITSIFTFESSVFIADVVGILEPAVAVVICSLPPYRILLSKLQKRDNRAFQQDEVEEGGVDIEPKRLARVHGSITELEMPVV